MTPSSKIINCYSTGQVFFEGAANPTNKGFAGRAIETDNYWDNVNSQQSGTSGNATGKDTVEMKTQSTFAGWDFADTWHMIENVTYPVYVHNESLVHFEAAT